MTAKFGTIGQEVIVRSQGRGAERRAKITAVGRKWVTVERERCKFDISTGHCDIKGHPRAVYLVTLEDDALAKRHANTVARLMKCGIRIEWNRDHPDYDALEKIAEIAEAGMPGAKKEQP